MFGKTLARFVPILINCNRSTLLPERLLLFGLPVFDLQAQNVAPALIVSFQLNR